ncbi:MAG: TraR/DksA C4-type zinc finger protein [Kofleriaceae bacterium]|jgi:DnaK suppressor protein|nr:TraR/DksA C4-type zinc finger protein [Kofleriaceae bacterium]MBP9171708.1 TraR/DksA C4-type zinc finger protein [Kofleriaceae bacterium]MBP9862188.1 TraR/DksA C4-type zinc finger protein [Kofleriaceae bacterium]
MFTRGCHDSTSPLWYAAFSLDQPLAQGNDVSTNSAAATAKPLTKKELQKFKELLEEKRRAVVDRARQTLTENMMLDPSDLPDEMDLASAEYTQSFEFRLRGRDKSLLSKLDLAIKKIDDGTFGNCESCDEPIGKKRLEARPETSLCIRCKEDQEREERTLG